MLVKLTPSVLFTKILPAAFLPLFFQQKNTKPNYVKKNTGTMLEKLTSLAIFTKILPAAIVPIFF